MTELAVLEIRDKVQRVLAETAPVRIDSDGDIVVRNGSSVTFVKVFAAGDERVLIKVEAPIAVRVPASPAFFRWVATHTDDWIFGHLAVLEGDEGCILVMRHTLLGNTVDPDEILRAVVGIAISADEVDDEVVGQFGGRTFISED